MESDKRRDRPQEEDSDVDEIVASVHENLERLVGDEDEDDDQHPGYHRHHLHHHGVAQQESLVAQFLKRFVVCTSLLLAVKFVYPIIMVHQNTYYCLYYHTVHTSTIVEI